MEISSEQIARFREDGFVSVDGLLDERGVEAARNAFDALFRSEFERGILPDEVNWKEGKSDPTLTRQICNGWKANAAVARIVLREDIGQAIASLADWQGTRILQDNLIWKPTGARPLGYHQDSAYLPWLAPQAMVSCWIALDDTTAQGGTMRTKTLRSFRLLRVPVEVRFITAGRGMAQGSTHRTDRGGPWLSTRSQQM